ncbi:septum site-determining protein MinC [Lysinibacillus sp. KU-BSD001]|uniref:septum site-determining protein MinC n=1 Tax=Lysinibacillus sp. KU-BSD001 TaxID=3141328 RepID=UPI0036E99C6E
MKKSYVHIKGTKDGLVLRLDDQCAYSELVEELEQKVSEGGIDGKVEVQLHLGNRYCTDLQKQQLIQVVQSTGKMLVSKILSDVLTIEESNQQVAQQKCETYVGIVRSGQIVRTGGDIVVIGDVNPNGRIEAGGNIYVLGKLKGIAHAGIEGNEEAVITAAFFAPTHVLIADQMEVMSNEQQFVLKHREQLCAYLNSEGEISYGHIQEVRKIRPFLDTFKGGS